MAQKAFVQVYFYSRPSHSPFGLLQHTLLGNAFENHLATAFNQCRILGALQFAHGALLLHELFVFLGTIQGLVITFKALYITIDYLQDVFPCWVALGALTSGPLLLGPRKLFHSCACETTALLRCRGILPFQKAGFRSSMVL